MTNEWPEKCGRFCVTGEGNTLVIDGRGLDLQMLTRQTTAERISGQALIDLVFYHLEKLSQPVTTPECVWLAGFGADYLCTADGRAQFLSRLLKLVQPQGDLQARTIYKGQIYIEAEQFVVTGREQTHYPVGMHPWSLEDARPRDMSWGYVKVGRQKVHVQSDDWIITYPNGTYGVLSDAEFQQFCQSGQSSLGQVKD